MGELSKEEKRNRKKHSKEKLEFRDSRNFQNIIEDPKDFVDHIKQHVTPPRGRELHVEVLESTYNFSSWLGGISQISGLAATHAEPDANHSWHFLRSDLLNKFVPRAAGDVEYSNEEWKDLAPDQRDTVLVVKQYLHHKDFSQPPLLAMPQSVAASLREETLKPSSLNPLGDRLLKEFRKTAEAIAAQPWNLLRGKMYLEKFCDDNEKEIVLQPPKLNCLFQYKMPALNLLPDLGEATHSAPRKVFVVKPVPKNKRKSLGEAKAKAKGKARADARRADADADDDAAAAERPADADAARADARPAGVDADEDAAERPADADAAMADERPAEADAGVADAAGPGAPPPAVVWRRPAGARVLVHRPAAAAAPGGMRNGCPKCRYGRYGCTQCRARARAGRLGYRFGGPDGREVLGPA